MTAGIPFVVAGQHPPLLKVGPAYVPGRGPCFTCHERMLARSFPLYPELAEYRRRHETTDVTLGPAAGFVGTALAVGVLNLLLDVPGESLIGRALLVDMETLEQRTEAIERDPGCPACGQLPWL